MAKRLQKGRRIGGMRRQRSSVMTVLLCFAQRHDPDFPTAVPKTAPETRI